MEILLEQRFRYAKIALAKNYCKLENKRIYEDNKFLDPGVTAIDLSNFSQKRKQSAYFVETVEYSEDSMNYNYPVFERPINHYTLSDKQITRNYNNPFADISIEILERTVRRNGTKILLTSSRYIKQRKYNDKFFKSFTEKSIFTFDFKTGNFQVIKIAQTNKNKKRASKVFRTNNFSFLKNIIKDSPQGIFNITRLKDDTKFKFHKEINEALNDIEYRELICKLFEIDSYVSLKKLNTNNYFFEKIQEKFINLRKIKVPNHSYEHLLMYHYPKEKYLKKNDRKLIASVLDMYGIKSKYTIKLLHKFPFFDIATLVMLCNVFGDNYKKYIASINDEIYSSSQIRINFDNQDFYGVNNGFKSTIDSFNISDDDKENVVRVLNDFQNKIHLDRHFINDLSDHFRMIHTIRAYDPSVKMKAKTRKEFSEEHRELSKTVAAISKGWVIEYSYDEKTRLQLEEPISDNESEKLYPYILKREEEYIEEGNFMHHCVASYADKEKSIIVSIRTEDHSNRVTCEFDIQSGIMVQARHFCNAKPPELFDESIETLQDKIRLLARFGTLNWKEKRKVPIMINGVEVKPSGPTLPF